MDVHKPDVDVETASDRQGDVLIQISWRSDDELIDVLLQRNRMA